MVYLPYLRIAAGLAAIAALASRAAGTSLAELLADRIAFLYPERPTGLLDRIRERLGLAPPPAQLTESPTERLRREIEKSDLTDETKLRLLNILDSKGYAVAAEEFRRALAAPLKL